MKKHLPTIIFVLIFLIGLSVLLYPVISNYINSIHQSQAIADYVHVVDRCSKKDIQKEFSMANHYNAVLRETPEAFYEPKRIDGYEDILDVSGTGIMKAFPKYEERGTGSIIASGLLGGEAVVGVIIALTQAIPALLSLK